MFRREARDPYAYRPTDLKPPFDYLILSDASKTLSPDKKPAIPQPFHARMSSVLP